MLAPINGGSYQSHIHDETNLSLLATPSCCKLKCEERSDRFERQTRKSGDWLFLIERCERHADGICKRHRPTSRRYLKLNGRVVGGSTNKLNIEGSPRRGGDIGFQR